MGNLPTNSSYGAPGGASLVPKSFRYVPPAPPRPVLKNEQLTRLNQPGAFFQPTPTPAAGTPEDYQARQAGIFQLGGALNNGKGVATETQFLPPSGDLRAPIPLPSDYGSFQEPMTIKNDSGENFSWGTPVDPVIRNLSGDVPGQYIQDTTNPEMLVKTKRGSNPLADTAMRWGRPGSMYQIDHIIPLSMGGADTLANRQVLTYEQNDKKTKAQSIPYTLMAHGDLTPREAMAMAMQWKDRDLTDVPQPNGVGLVPDVDGKTGIEFAREVAERWKQPKPPTFKDVMAGIPEAAKDFGKGFLPGPIREFAKGLVSGGTAGFVPYEAGEEAGLGSKVTGIAGFALGSLAPWSVATKVFAAPFALARMGQVAFNIKNVYAVTQAATSGFGLSKAGLAAAKAAEAQKLIAPVAGWGSTIAPYFPKTIRKVPGYVEKFFADPVRLKQAGTFGGISAVFGQAHQFVANHFNPYILSDQAPDTEQKGMIGNIFKDLALGAVTGIATPTLKGTAYTIATPMALSFWADPDDPVAAITNGVLFGVMHGTATYKRPGYNDVVSFGGKPYENPVSLAYDHVMNHAAYTQFRQYNKKLPEVKIDQEVPTMSAEKIEEMKQAAISDVLLRYGQEKNLSPEDMKTVKTQLKAFSKDVDTKVDSQAEIPELSFMDKLSPSKRRERTDAIKAQTESIQQNFGPGYQKRNTIPDKLGIDKITLPETGMDLQDALTEIKRLTISARQLYKKTLSPEMRKQADLDDLMSYSKWLKEQQAAENIVDPKKYDFYGTTSKETLVTPPVVPQAYEALVKAHPDFMTKTIANPAEAPSGKFKVGDIPVTGAATSAAGKERIRYVFEQKNKGNVSPNAIAVKRDDMEAILTKLNKSRTAEELKAGMYENDPTPGKAVQLFAVVRNPEKGGIIEFVEIGMIPSDFRLNRATHQDHVAFNQHPAVLDWHASGGQKGLPPLTPENHKATIFDEMTKNNIDSLIVSWDPRATYQTVTSGQPFGLFKVSDANWNQSIGLKDTTPAPVNPVSIDIARVNGAKDAKDLSEKIVLMKNNPARVKNASESLPKETILAEAETNRAVVPQKITKDLVITFENSLDVASPTHLKEAFAKNLRINLSDEQAAVLFNKRNDITLREGLQLIMDEANLGGSSVEMMLKAQMMKTYVNSGAIQASPNGPATLEMPLLGRKTKYTGQEDVAAPEVATNPVRSVPVAETAPTIQKVEESVPTIQKVEEPQLGIQKVDDFADRLAKTYRTTLSSFESPTSGIEIPQTTNPLRSSGPEEITPTRNINDAFPNKEVDDWETSHQRRIYNDAETATTEKELVQAETAQKHYISHDPVEKPKFVAREFFNDLDRGMSQKDNPGAYYFAKAFDKALTEMLGKDYRKDPALPKILADYFKKSFFNEENSMGRPIEQHKAIVEARGKGLWDSERAAFKAREQDHENNNYENLKTIQGMTVKPDYLESDMVRDLTHGEDLMSALFSGVPQNGAISVRGVEKLFVGFKYNPGLREFIIKNHPNVKSKAVHLKTLEKEAVAVDTARTEKNKTTEAEVDLAKKLLPEEKAKLERIIASFKSDPENPAPKWQTPEMEQNIVSDITSNINKYKTLSKDGGGGPGIHDGKGGMIGDAWKTLKQKTNKLLAGEPIIYNAEQAPAPVVQPKANYNVRGVDLNDDDINAIAPIIFGEVSNRPEDKQAFETRHIINTGINRIANNPKHKGYGATLTEVFQRPNQYQAYAPKGTINESGETVESQYQKAIGGKLDAAGQKRYELVKQVLNELKSGKFDDTTGGGMFYTHASDGTIWLGSTTEESVNRAKAHERQNGLTLTPFNTARGLAAS